MATDKPHDRLVKKLLSNPEAARDVLEVYLPLEVKEKLDLSYLERQPDSFVDDEHRVMEVDILFKTRVKDASEDAYIWILIAQQRNPDAWLPVKKFYYIGTIWNHLRKTSKKKTVPLIYPIVISNSSYPYTHSLTLRDMIEPDSAKEIFDNLFKTPFCLVDLAAIEDDLLRNALQNHVRGRAILLSLKHVFDRNLQPFFEEVMLSDFRGLDTMGYTDEVGDMILYLLNEGDFPDMERFENTLRQTFSKQVEEKVMTLAERFEQRGEARGEARGETRGEARAIQKIAMKLLQEGCDVEFVAKATGLSIDDFKLLKEKVTN